MSNLAELAYIADQLTNLHTEHADVIRRYEDFKVQEERLKKQAEKIVIEMFDSSVIAEGWKFTRVVTPAKTSYDAAKVDTLLHWLNQGEIPQREVIAALYAARTTTEPKTNSRVQRVKE